MTSHDAGPTVPRQVAVIDAKAPHQDWRASYATAVLIGVLVLGFLVLTPNIYFQSSPWLTLVFFGVYAILGAAVAWRGTLALKIGLSVAILGASGIGAILSGGSPTNGTFFFVALVTVVTLLGSPRSGAAATAITLVVVAVVAGLSGFGLIATGASNAALQSPAGWIGAALAILLFGAAMALGVSHLKRGAGPEGSSETSSPVAGDRADPPVARPPVSDRSDWLQKSLETGGRLNATLDSDDAASQLAGAVSEVFGYPGVEVMVLDPDRDALRLAAQAGTAPVPAAHQRPQGQSLAAQAIRSGVAQVASPLSDVGGDEGDQDTLLAPAAAVPVMREGRAIAALLVQAAGRGSFEAHEIEALEWVARQAAPWLARPRSHEEPTTTAETPVPLQEGGSSRRWNPDTNEEAGMEYEFGDSEVPESAPEIRVPLSLRDEEIGTIRLAAGGDWSAEEQSLVEAVAAQAALALENARLMEARQLSAAREHALAEITAKVWGAATLDGILRTTIEELALAFGADRATVELRMDTDDAD